MLNLCVATVQIWSHEQAASRHCEVSLSYDVHSETLSFKQYPTLAINSKSFVGLSLPLSTIRPLSCGTAVRATGLVSIMVREPIKAIPSLDCSNYSSEEELVTLEMCCSLIDCSIAENSKMDLLANINTTESGNLELLLSLLSDSTSGKHHDSNETQTDLSTERVNLSLSGKSLDKHSEDDSVWNKQAWAVATSSDTSSWPTSRDDQPTVSSMPSGLDQKESITQANTSTSRTILCTRCSDADHIVRWNVFAESNGAIPRQLPSTSVHDTVSRNDQQFQAYEKTRVDLATVTGGYLNDRRRDYTTSTEDHHSTTRDGNAARRRNIPKTARHSTAQTTYNQPYFMQDSIMAKHGSLW